MMRALEEVCIDYRDTGVNLRHGWIAILSTCPPLPADIEAAVELAKGIAAHYAHLRAEYPGTWGKDTTSEERIARALRKACGREVDGE